MIPLGRVISPVRMFLIPYLAMFALLLGAPIIAQAACSGSSPNLTAATIADIQLCYNGASSGDTISYTGGNAAASGGSAILATTTTSKYVIVDGNGATITDNTTAGEGGNDLFALTESTAGSIILKNFIITAGTASHTGTSAFVSILYTSGGKPVIVKDNTFNNTAGAGNQNAMRATTNRGLITGNTFQGKVSGLGTDCFNGQAAIRLPALGLNATWATPSTYGNADTNGDGHLYFEHNTVNEMLQAIDVDDNARMVVRFNTIRNGGLTVHGDTSFPGGRYFEAYNNTWSHPVGTYANCPDGAGPATFPLVNMNSFFNSRAGTGRIIENTIPDLNDGVWGDKGEVKLSADMLQRPDSQAFVACWGDGNHLTEGYPGPAFVGWGYTSGGTSVTTARSVPAGFSTPFVQDLEPIYIGANTGGGNYTAPSIGDYGGGCTAPLDVAATYIQADREYYAQNASCVAGGACASGVGTGASLPTSCTVGVAFIKTSGGTWNSSGTAGGGADQNWLMYRCTAPNTFTLFYTPYVYPHPLATVTGSDISAVSVTGRNLLKGTILIR